MIPFTDERNKTEHAYGDNFDEYLRIFSPFPNSLTRASLSPLIKYKLEKADN
jgi:hypothetical protein